MFCPVLRAKIVIEAMKKVVAIVVRTDVNVFIFDTSPKPLDEGIISCPTFSIHTQSNVLIFDYIVCEDVTGVLTTLISVDDFRLPMDA
jgi:hypothetical protein